MERNDFIEKILGGVFAVVAVVAAVTEIFVNGVSAESIIAGVKDIFGTLAVVVLFLAIVKDKIPAKDFKKAFDDAMAEVCEKYRPLIRKELLNVETIETASQRNKFNKLEKTICYQMADNINVLFGQESNNYKRFLEIENQNTTVIKLLIRKTFFNYSDFNENSLKDIAGKITTRLEKKFNDYKISIIPKGDEIHIDTQRLMSSKADAALLADLVDHAVMLYIAESKK